MNKFLTVILLLITFSACQKNEISNNEAIELPKEYSLSFWIHSVNYYTEDSDSTYVTCNLDTERGFTTKKVDKYFWNIDPENTDSTYVLNSLVYHQTDESTFEYNSFEIGFEYYEALANLTATSDSTFVYNDPKTFYQTLQNRQWDTNLYGENYNNSNFQFTILDSEVENWHTGNLTNNGFYFDFENMTTDKLDYDDTNQEINMSGQFDVSLKIMSCGYWEFYHAKEGQFEVVF